MTSRNFKKLAKELTEEFPFLQYTQAEDIVEYLDVNDFLDTDIIEGAYSNYEY